MLLLAFSAGKEHSMTDSDICSLDALLEAYEKYQRRTRGLNDRTLRGYGQFVRPFIREALGDDPIDVRRLDPGAVIRFVGVLAAGVRNPESLQILSSPGALRGGGNGRRESVSATFSGSGPDTLSCVGRAGPGIPGGRDRCGQR